MVHWNSSPHPISDVRDWKEAERLELRPDFQRLEVWSSQAKIMLMDTILRGIPMPKIFLANKMRDEKTYRVVIDGQQRMNAILEFLRGNFSLEKPYEGPHQGKVFSQLDRATKDRFLSYNIDFNEAVNPTDEEVREVYSRVNKYTVPLNKQELRRADFPGDFLDAAEELSTDPYFERIRIFTPANRRRYADVEYMSELMVARIAGIQDGKSTLDDFYLEYATWNTEGKKQVLDLFAKSLAELDLLFDENKPISVTRFRQKTDFYSLFLAVGDFLLQGHSVVGKSVEFLRKDIQLLDLEIAPESDIKLCSEYAIKCVSQANSASSRKWRDAFLKSILRGTYLGAFPDADAAEIFYSILSDCCRGDPMCSESMLRCPGCGKETPASQVPESCLLAWPANSEAYQLTNAEWIHRDCLAIAKEWAVLQRPNSDQPNLL